jgi:hypothetical protein
MMNVRNILIGFVVSAVLLGVIVSCGGGGGGDTAPPTYTVGGNITGATGTVVLKLNGGSDTPMAAAGAFTFPTGLVAGSTYNVQVAAPNQRCTVTSGAGSMGAANISNVAIACGAQTTQTVIRSAVLNGAQEGSRSTATGVGGVIVDPTNADVNGAVLITGGITFSGLTPTTGGHHIHQAPVGNPTGTGPVIIGLTLASDGQTAFVPSGTRLTPVQYTALLAGELYFNVHSTNLLCGPDYAPTACTGGEIRGQITAQGGVLAAVANLNAAQEVTAVGAPDSASTATGTGTLLADAATRTILISYITHNVTNATLNGAHIHANTGGPGTNGPVTIGFNQALGANLAFPTFGTQMSVANVSSFFLNYLYFNVHSTNNLCGPAGTTSCAAGEIRGNITPIP